MINKFLEERNYKLENPDIKISSSKTMFNVVCCFNHTYETNIDNLYIRSDGQQRACTECNSKNFLNNLRIEINTNINKNHIIAFEVLINGTISYYCYGCNKFSKHLYSDNIDKCESCIPSTDRFIEQVYTSDMLDTATKDNLISIYESRNKYIDRFNKNGFLVISPYINAKKR